MIPGCESEQAVVVRVALRRSEVGTGRQDLPEVLFQTYAQSIYLFALRRVGAPEVAEDIAAEVFLEATLRWKASDVRDPLPWLYGVARRKTADHLRVAARRPAEALTEQVPASSGGPHEALELQELRRMVEALPPEQREALLLHYLEGLTAEQIGIVMGRTRAAVNSLLQRARHSLRMKSEEKSE
jgi:RNA polymerase sigma-70 factor (ECF subfamily)